MPSETRRVVAVLVRGDGRAEFKLADGTTTPPRHAVANLATHPAEWLALDEARANRNRWIEVNS